MSVPGPQGDERPWRRLLRRAGVDLRAGEDAAALLLFFCFFLIVTFQYTTKSVRQSTYIDGLGAAQLPWVYLAVALASYPLLLLYGRFADRYARRSVMVATCGLVAASMVVFWWLFGSGATWVTVALYVWLSIVYVLTVNQFWSYSNHVFDARQAKRLFGFVGAGGLLGGVAGGQVAKFATKAVGTRATLLLGGALLFAVVAILQAIKRVEHHGETEEPARRDTRVAQARGGLAIIRGSRHLQMVAAIMVLGVVVAQIVDLQFNWAIEQRTVGLDQRTAFFGNFFSIMGISALVFQLLFTAAHPPRPRRGRGDAGAAVDDGHRHGGDHRGRGVRAGGAAAAGAAAQGGRERAALLDRPGDPRAALPAGVAGGDPPQGEGVHRCLRAARRQGAGGAHPACRWRSAP